jgi:hypothetical protein
MPIIKNFRATNVWKAFILNSILTSVIILVSVTSKQYLDNYIIIDNNDDDKKGNNKIVHTTNFKSLMISLLLTFTISMLSYTIMYFTFGYGSGMLVSN